MSLEFPDFRGLFRTVESLEDPRETWKVLALWLKRHKGARCAPESFKRREHSQFLLEWPYELHNLYALSRLSQILLIPFQRGRENVSLDQYIEFFETLGMDHFIDRPFSPYYHEVVSLEEVDDPSAPPRINDLVWPGLVFGDMLFSRAGIKVQCGQGRFVKKLIESSTLYFAYKRHKRECSDTSQGWGGNSQWNTVFRRCYEDSDNFYYNVDGEWLIGNEKSSGRIRWLPDRNRFSNEQRIEVLKWRCWVTHDGGEAFPFWDKHIEAKG